MVSVVVGVPHSGCRTLAKHLDAKKEHFWYNHPFRPRPGDEVHVALRDPMSVAESWARRGKDINQLLCRYRYMFEYLERETPKIWRIEDLPRLAGTQDTDVNRGSVPAIAKYRDLVIMYVIVEHQEFFTSHGYKW